MYRINVALEGHHVFYAKLSEYKAACKTVRELRKIYTIKKGYEVSLAYIQTTSEDMEV